MKILHGLDGDSDVGFGAGERELHVATCRANVLDSILSILEACDSLDLSPGLTEAGDRVRKAAESDGCGPPGHPLATVLTPELARDVARLWQEPGVQTLAGRLSQVTIKMTTF